MIKEIVTDPLFLSRKAQACQKKDLGLAQDLLDTLSFHKENCLGLAANMIGVAKAAIIIDTGLAPLVLFNPKIIEKSQIYLTQESCLSHTGSKPCQRYQSIKVAYQDRNFQDQVIQLDGLLAQICQHEMDHLDGRLI